MSPLLDPQRLVLARQLHGLTQEALAASLGVEQSWISMLESGVEQPSPERLEQLSQMLACSEQFLTPAEGHEASLAEHPSEVFFRSLKSTPRASRLRAQGICGAVELVSLMLEEFGTPLPRVRLPLARGQDLDEEELPKTDDSFLPVDNAHFNEVLDGLNPQQLAYETRRVWGLSDGPIPNVLSLIEEHGVVATVVPDMDADTIDAFSYWRGARPIVVLNHKKQDPFRSRFDTAHELGHLLMHRGLPSMMREDTGRAPRAPADKMEMQAHTFAGEFIVPASRWITEAPRSINPFAYLPFKERWGLSVKALIVRSHRAGILNTSQYTAAMKRYSSLGWNQGEPRSDIIDHERPSMLQNVIVRAAEWQGFSPRAYLKQLLLLPDMIADLVLPTKETPSVVSLAGRRDRTTRAADDPRVQRALSETIVPVYDPQTPYSFPKKPRQRGGKVLTPVPERSQ